MDVGKYTKRPQSIPSGHKIYQMDGKIYQMATKYTNIFRCVTLQDLHKLGFFCLKIYHLATLMLTVSRPLFMFASLHDSAEKEKNGQFNFFE
jgi:hypothetical protein